MRFNATEHVRNCRNCQKTFWLKLSSPKLFCSPQCKWSYNNRHRTLKPNISGKCKVCKKAFSRYVEPSKIRSGQATAEYCSRACKGLALSGDKHPMWKGGRCIVNGYIWIHSPSHPNAKHQGYVLEHRLVMEKKIGRLLTKTEVVHHINGNTQDNQPENLRLYATNAEHKRDEHGARIRNATGQLLAKG